MTILQQADGQAGSRVRRVAIAMVLGVVILAGLPAVASANHNDDWQVALPLNPFESDTTPNSDTGLQTNEPFAGGSAYTCDGAQVDNTIWYRVPGTGGPVTVHTRGSSIDTFLAVYDSFAGPSLTNVVACNDDIVVGDPPPDADSEVVFNTRAGASYLVQIGSCYLCTGGSSPEGLVQVAAYSAPGNDNRASPATLNPGQPLASRNSGATSEGGEVLSCKGEPFGKTVWYRFNAPGPGTATFTASGLDTVLSVYRGAGFIDCNDDGVPGQVGPSRLALPVTAGEYFVQVGGYGTGIAADYGGLTLQAEFTARSPDPIDADRDGVSPPLDCNDGNATVRPGIPEVRGNGIDENCDRIVEPYERVSARRDVGWRSPGRTTRFSKFFVLDVPAGATVTLLCRGKGCPRKKYSRTFAKATKKHDLYKQLKGRKLRPGAVVELQVASPGKIGIVARYVIRKNKAPKVTPLCLPPGASKAVKC